MQKYSNKDCHFYKKDGSCQAQFFFSKKYSTSLYLNRSPIARSKNQRRFKPIGLSNKK